VTLSAGSRLGPYEIVSPLGAGGMGEVYRAKDPRLGRDVAVKVLPASFSDDADRLRRFEQEARAAGLLNHPNITAVFDIGSHEGAPYVVSELLEGETLRAALAGGRLSARKAIDHAIQLAQGLAAAHEKGIVHRDLKPENVFVTRDGRVKILDFGLAKLTHTEGGSGERTNLPTDTAGTEPGVVLGTMGYMAPEQVRGRPADARSDIFAFGAILYEMLSGKRAFQGDSAADTMSAILREDPPDLSVTNQNVSPGLERILRHCLEKNPEQRFQSARDLAFDLEALSGVSAPRGATVTGLAPIRVKRFLPLAIAGAVVAAALAGAYLAGKKAGFVPAPSFSQLTFRRGQIYSARFAPDGHTILYSAGWDGKPIEIFASRLETPESRPFGVTGAGLLGISPAGEMALSLNNRSSGAFARTGTLARVSVAGGAAPREIQEDVLWADWSPDGKDLAIVRELGAKQQLEYPLGTVVYQTDGWISHPRVSPNGNEVAFADHPLGGDDGGSVAIVDRSGKKKTVSQTFASLQGLAWPPHGKEVWFSAATVGFNRSLHAATRSGRHRVLARATGGLVLQDVAKDGRVLVTQEKSRQELLVRVEGDAKERDLSWLDWSLAMDLSADGRTLLFDESGEGGGKGYSVYVRRTDGSPAVRLGEGSAQSLSPDSRWVLAIVSSTSDPQLIAYPTGAGQPKTFPKDGLNVQEASWLPNGKRILLNANEEGRGVRIWIRDFESGKPRALTPEGYRAFQRTISPDGKSVVARGPDRRFYIYPLEGGEPVALSGLAAEGEFPGGWSADGRLYVTARGVPGKVYLLDVATGNRELWKEFLPADSAGVAPFGGIRVTPDGKAYAYSFLRVLGELFVAEGVR
jgi:eukaryotic-like serine/threonine-protein kinase